MLSIANVLVKLYLLDVIFMELTHSQVIPRDLS